MMPKTRQNARLFELSTGLNDLLTTARFRLVDPAGGVNMKLTS